MTNLDPKNVFGSTAMLPDQCSYIWEMVKNMDFPDNLKSASDITLCGMGGSRYGAYIVQSLYNDMLKVPFFGYGDYHIPAYLSKKSLFILSSYSGGTEEPISSAEEVLERGYPVIGITSGGKVLEMSKKHNFPSIVFDQKYNPSHQPRLGTGYMVLGTIAILTRLGYLQISDDEVKKAIEELQIAQEEIKNKAKEEAEKLQGYIPLIFAAQHLAGNAHIIRNQLNETSKSFSAFEDIPELNHHLMEGLKNPQDKKLMAIFLVSDFYEDKHKKRITLTEDIVSQNGIECLEYKPTGSSKLSQCLNVLSFGGYLTLYLAFAYGQDPGVVPWVDYFKEQLAKTKP
ncbi:MAG: bifunctional phosphoglucose/phosphomannose isomerase [Candidatus Daviesbacteria bacterium]|nr:bifunctional phosphoglucose/phosphomannose isomerase [Candidatus Daviesbacteria bacterium]